MRSAVLKLAAAALGASLLAGCAGIREHRGYVMDDQLSQAVQVGIDNKASVEKTLGRPTFTGQFSPDDWYYVSRDTSAFAFRNPRVTKQSILHVGFDPAGNVATVNTTGKELVASINPVDETTPTLGRKRGFFEDLLANIGSVSSGGLGAQQPPTN
jgi:outer membrane protein assembly factor BamE (lipoprotein component of BamABCDE complex)